MWLQRGVKHGSLRRQNVLAQIEWKKGKKDVNEEKMLAYKLNIFFFAVFCCDSILGSILACSDQA